ncbi:MAG: DNA translocase FtsK 4TM domain-containing protein [Candidatus Gracilibacteria bacterium]|nr:DNA translocase FtsK 4TM domain-containing protein [Candidatus Gracilibacteria bacterium]
MARRKTRRKTTRRRKLTHRSSVLSELNSSLPRLDLKKKTVREISSVIMILFSILFFLSLSNKAGIFGEYFKAAMTALFGWGAWVLPIILIVLSILILSLPSFVATFSKIFGSSLAFVSILGIMHMSVPMPQILEAAQRGENGGYLGFTVNSILRHFFGDTGAMVVLISLLIISFLITFEFSLSKILGVFTWLFQGEENPELKVRINQGDASRKLKRITKKEVVEEKPVVEKKTESAAEILKKAMEKEEKKNSFQPKFKASSGNWNPPGLDLLDDNSFSIEADDKEIARNVAKIEEALANFGIEVTMGEVNVGPTVTQYTLKPADGIKLSKITALQNDLALALAARSIRIEAPIPGKSLVGIELPNKKRAIVGLREILESEDFQKEKSNLKIVFGRDVSGKPAVSDLKRMPHLLIAGATGSGKSVCINTILLSFLYQNSPDDLKLILVDPKRVELNSYNHLPHLLTPVIVEPEKTVAALRWAVSEMNRRYKLFQEAREQNIAGYNKNNTKDKIPYIVIVVDELADLMMVAPKEVEASICRIAQLARATGIHLIVATQRPSVDVITGLIKANIPSRVAFTVSSGTDSRTIIDTVGAEKLLGQGDMLFLDSGVDKPVRLQGVYVSNDEIKRITSEIKLSTPPEYDDSIIEKKEIPRGLPNSGSMGVLKDSENKDDLEQEATALILETGKASASLLQRRLSVGYARAARLLDILEEKGVIGPANGAKAREIFMKKD